MKAFLTYFFGQGTEAEYANFTLAHFAPVVLAVCVIFLIRSNRDRIREWKHEQAIRYVLAFALIITDMSYYWRLAVIPSLGGQRCGQSAPGRVLLDRDLLQLHGDRQDPDSV